MAVSVASLVGFASKTSSQRTRDSSTFCDRTSASAFSAWRIPIECWCHFGKEAEGTLISSFRGYFLRSLLQVTIADLLEPVSRASRALFEYSSIHPAGNRRGKLTVDGANLTFESGSRHRRRRLAEAKLGGYGGLKERSDQRVFVYATGSKFPRAP